MNLNLPGQIYSYDLTVKEHHLDTFGHVNNATYLELLEEARWELITKAGYGLKVISTTGHGPVILEVHLTFDREIKNREFIKITTQCLEYTGKVGKLRQVIVNGQGEECSTAEFTFGLFDTRLRKLIEPTPAWLEAIGVL